MTSQNKNAPITNSNESALLQDCNQNNTHHHPKTSNVNESRALSALIKAGERGISRKELDAVCASSNSPEIIRRLRAKGFVIHCEMRSVENRFGETVQAGYYRLMQQGVRS